MRDPAIENVGPADPAPDGAHATADLGDHPTRNRAVGHQRVQLIGRRLADQALRVGDRAAKSFDVGQVHEFLRAERFRDRAGDRVGVDVVGLSGHVAADRCDDGDQFFVEEAIDDRRVDIGDIANKAEFGVAWRCDDETCIGS